MSKADILVVDAKQRATAMAELLARTTTSWRWPRRLKARHARDFAPDLSPTQDAGLAPGAHDRRGADPRRRHRRPRTGGASAWRPWPGAGLPASAHRGVRRCATACSRARLRAEPPLRAGASPSDRKSRLEPAAAPVLRPGSGARRGPRSSSRKSAPQGVLAAATTRLARARGPSSSPLAALAETLSKRALRPRERVLPGAQARREGRCEQSRAGLFLDPIGHPPRGVKLLAPAGPVRAVGQPDHQGDVRLSRPPPRYA